MATRQAGRELGGQMPGAYDPRAVEDRIYRFWEEQGYFAPNAPLEDWEAGRRGGSDGREPFTIIMPPPNVTGELHIGHALTAAIEDGLVRWHRMKGDPTLWLPGTDHAGIATQTVVERELAKEALTRHDLGREKFVERVWMWVRKYRSRIDDQHRRLGASCDWSRNRFTMDETPQLAVRTTFKHLYEDGLIYRGTRIINWCPRCQTALSDLEVDHQEADGHLYQIKYPLIDAEGRETGRFIEMATTRPETIVGDVAVAVNPGDDRWRDVIGTRARLPIIGRELSIIGDGEVDPRFGTGAVKVTPGHDPNDYEMGLRHNLPVITVMNPDASMNAEAGPYNGMTREETRTRIIDDFDAAGLLVKIEPYRTSIGHCDRCDTIVEPLVSPQWYVRMQPLAQPAIGAVRDGTIRITPERHEKVYLNWMENIRDWCISRQLWWGHRIPVWYCDACGKEIVEIETPVVCTACGSGEPRQDEDVLDTWFSSGLWTHSTLGWPRRTKDLAYFYPTSVMETGWDILFFWVARMIMLGLYNMGTAPFHTVYLHGMVRDDAGAKMSKSKGNVVDPLIAVDEYGADALRFTLATGSSSGNDMRWSRDRIEASQHFCNKLWNAARFVMQKLEGEQTAAPTTLDGLPLEDRWILSRVNGLAGEVNQLLADFQLGEAARRIHDFLWNEYCDWYIEAAKIRLNQGDTSPRPVLAHVLATGLKLLHPFAPFVTEEIWQNLRRMLPAAESAALIVAAYPEARSAWHDATAEVQMDALVDAVRAVRNLRAEKRLEAGRYVEAYIGVEDATLRAAFAARAEMIAALARARPLHIVSPAELPTQEVTRAVLDASIVVLPLAGLIDMEAEGVRLQKDLGLAAAQRERLTKQLANQNFRSKAPAEVVRKLEEDLTTLEARIIALRSSLDALH